MADQQILDGNKAMDLTEQQQAEIDYYESLEREYYEQKNTVPCPSCDGEGSYAVECCNGSGGCSCRGGLVDMGRCNVCHGSGYVINGQYNPSANVNYLMAQGACFAGSGPSRGYWSTAKALNRPSKY